MTEVTEPVGDEDARVRTRLAMEVDPRDPSRIWLYTSEWIRPSTDGGRTFKQVGALDEKGKFRGAFDVEVTYLRDRPVVVVAPVLGSAKGAGFPVFVSRDAGASWTPVLFGRPARWLASNRSGDVFICTDTTLMAKPPAEPKNKLLYYDLGARTMKDIRPGYMRDIFMDMESSKDSLFVIPGLMRADGSTAVDFSIERYAGKK